MKLLPKTIGNGSRSNIFLSNVKHQSQSVRTQVYSILIGEQHFSFLSFSSEYCIKDEENQSMINGLTIKSFKLLIIMDSKQQLKQLLSFIQLRLLWLLTVAIQIGYQDDITIFGWIKLLRKSVIYLLFIIYFMFIQPTILCYIYLRKII